VALVGPGVGEGLARLGNELPIVATEVQGELQDPIGTGVAHLAVGLDDAEGALAPATGADDELPYPLRRIGRALRRLGGEALVVVVVAVQDHLCARRILDVPARSHPGVVAVFGAGAEEGVVEVG
jgi:hypothetical protein